jgi:hypothetical protein
LFCFQLKKLENTYNGTSAVGMRAIVPDSDQNPFSVYETTLNDAKIKLLDYIRHVDRGKINFTITRTTNRLQSGSVSPTRNNEEKGQVKMMFHLVKVLGENLPI